MMRLIFSFDGQVDRSQYWTGLAAALGLLAGLAGLLFIGGIMGYATGSAIGGYLFFAAVFFPSFGIPLALTWPVAALATKRAVDIGLGRAAVVPIVAAYVGLLVPWPIEGWPRFAMSLFFLTVSLGGIIAVGSLAGALDRASPYRRRSAQA